MIRGLARAATSFVIAFLVGVALVMEWTGRPFIVLIVTVSVVGVGVLVYRRLRSPHTLWMKDGHYYLPRVRGERQRRCVACGDTRETIWGRDS